MRRFFLLRARVFAAVLSIAAATIAISAQSSVSTQLGPRVNLHNARTGYLLDPAIHPGARVVTDSQVDAYIDSTLPIFERSIIKRVMLTLPLNARENVAFFSSDGKLYANSRRLKSQMRIYSPVSLGSNIYVDDTGHRFAGPPDTSLSATRDRTARRPVRPNANGSCATPPASDSSGPFRRVYWCGYSSFGANVTLPCFAMPPSYTGADTGYEQSGGFSRFGDAADAGFFYSNRNNWYSLFLSVFSNHRFSVLGGSLQYKCGVPPSGNYLGGAGISFLAFATELATFATGYQTDGTLRTFSLVQDVQAIEGWNTAGFSGEGVVMKQMTTIAQDPSALGYVPDGDSFGLDPFSGAPSVQWSQEFIGECDAGGNLNNPNCQGTTVNPDGSQDFPNNPSYIRVTSNAITQPWPGGELNGIQLP